VFQVYSANLIDDPGKKKSRVWTLETKNIAPHVIDLGHNHRWTLGYQISSDSYVTLTTHTEDIDVDTRCFYPKIRFIRDEYYFGPSGHSCLNGMLVTDGSGVPCMTEFGMRLLTAKIGGMVTCSQLGIAAPVWCDSTRK